MKKNKGAPRASLVNTRKALRKQKRQEKKIHRKEHYLKKKSVQEAPKYEPGKFVKRPADAPDPDIEVKKKKPKQQPFFQDIMSRQIEKEKSETKKLKSEMEKQRKKMMVQANEEEDKVIKKLEKQLGLNKAKNKNNYFADDGLDYLLEICDRATSEQIVAAEKHLANVENESDFEEDLAVVTGKKTSKKNKDIEVNDEDISGSNNEDSDAEDHGHSDDDVDLSGIEDGNDSEMSDASDDLQIDDGDMTEDEPEELPTKSQKSQNPRLKTKNEENKLDNASNKSKKPKMEEKSISEDDLSKVFSDDEVSHLSGDDDLDGSSGDKDDDGDEPKESKGKPDIWEDIYGRKRDKEGNIIKEEKGVYIPPHLRNKDSATDKELVQLKRQVKSVLNKLAGTNLHWACTTIENLYSNNSRNSVNCALTQLWLDATVGLSVTPDRLVAEHAALVSVLHANVGNEIGAHFLQELSKKFDEMMLHPQPQEDKRLDNLVSCLAHLYCFKIYQASLLYDILSRLLAELSEKNIECVLVALRSVGGVLRKEEPLALKSFIHDTQTRVAKLSESAATGSRIKFLLEVLMAVKNNNLTKIPNYDPTYVEHLRKLTRGIVRRGNYVTPLNIRLEDLLKAEERGKWWVVGSAWEGSQVRQEEKGVKLPPTADQKLLELARKQRMNTDVRRSIFCIIMAAEYMMRAPLTGLMHNHGKEKTMEVRYDEINTGTDVAKLIQDYMDAFEKLQHLGLKGQQEREIVHVLMACCLQEKSYNPYYAVLAQKLCDTDRRYQLSLQFSIWDKIKELENLAKQNVTNLAQFLVHLIMEKGLPLSILKIIQFSDLNKTTVRFMRQILLAIIMNVNLETALEVFYRISKPPKLHMFRESLKLFIQHFLIKNAGKKTEVLSDDEMATLKERAVEVDKILTMHESKLRL